MGLQLAIITCNHLPNPSIKHTDQKRKEINISLPSTKSVSEFPGGTLKASPTNSRLLHYKGGPDCDTPIQASSPSERSRSTGCGQKQGHYLTVFFRNSSRVGPFRPRGSSGTMKRFPTKVKGSRLDVERGSHRNDLADITQTKTTRSYWLASSGIFKPLPRILTQWPEKSCFRERSESLPYSHRSLMMAIHLSDSSARSRNWSLETMIPSVSSASFTMNLSRGNTETILGFPKDRPHGMLSMPVTQFW